MADREDGPYTKNNKKSPIQGRYSVWNPQKGEDENENLETGTRKEKNKQTNKENEIGLYVSDPQKEKKSEEIKNRDTDEKK